MYAIRLTTVAPHGQPEYWYGDDRYTMDKDEAAKFLHKERAQETIVYFRMKNCEVVEIAE